MVLVTKFNNKTKDTLSKEGRMKIVRRFDNKEVRMPVIVKGYKNRYCHYIIICRDVKMQGKEMLLNLNKCKVTSTKERLQITQDNADGDTLFLEALNRADSEKWVEFMMGSQKMDKFKNQQHIFRTEYDNCLSAVGEEDEP